MAILPAAILAACGGDNKSTPATKCPTGQTLKNGVCTAPAKPVTCTPPKVLKGGKCVAGTNPTNPTNPTTPTTPTTPTSPVGASKLPHTGVTANQCLHETLRSFVSCTNPGAIALSGKLKQDGMRAHINPMSYSLVPKTGGGTYAKTECVKDNVTGLIWEGKTNDGGLRDYRKYYTNFDDATMPQKASGKSYATQAEIDAANNSVGYVKAVNATGLCGYSDWRLPTVDELQSIVNYGLAHPAAIDTDWFLNFDTVEYNYWTSEPVSDPRDPSKTWYVGFGSGTIYYGSRDGAYKKVRLVRGE